MTGELDQMVARLKEIRNNGPGGLLVTADINQPGVTPVGWCLGSDGNNDWYLATKGELGLDAQSDAEGLAYLYNALPAIIDALTDLLMVRQLADAFEKMHSVPANYRKG